VYRLPAFRGLYNPDLTRWRLPFLPCQMSGNTPEIWRLFPEEVDRSFSQSDHKRDVNQFERCDIDLII
jgi:hypothetical protein